MLDQLIQQLKGQVGPELISKIGLNQQQADGSIEAAADSVKQVVGGADGFGMDDVLNLFSGAKNSSAADGILKQVGQVFSQKLTGQVGLNGQQAGGVADLVLPALTKLLSEKVGGNAGNLQGLLGGDIAGKAKGMLGGLFKKK